MDINLIIKTIFFGAIVATIGVFLVIRADYRSNILKILNDMLLAYKNFFHWNISKIVLDAYSWLFGLIVSSPLIAFVIFLLYKTTEKLGSESVNAFSEIVKSGNIPAIFISLTSFGLNSIWLMLTMLFILLIITVFLFFFLYSYLLLQNIYKNYMEGKKLQISKFSTVSALAFLILSLISAALFSENPYLTIGSVIGIGILSSPFFIFGILKSENYYLSYRFIWKFIGVTCWSALYLLIPAFFVVAILALSQSPSVEAAIGSNNLVMAVFVLALLGTLLFFIYAGVRLLFTNLTLLDDAENLSRPAKSFVLESLAITKGRTIKIIGLAIPFVMVSIILTEMISFINSLSPYASLFTGILDFLFLSGIGFMIVNSLYGIFNDGKYPMAIKYDDDGLEIIEMVRPGSVESTPVKEIPAAAKKTPLKKAAPKAKTK